MKVFMATAMTSTSFNRDVDYSKAEAIRFVVQDFKLRRWSSSDVELDSKINYSEEDENVKMELGCKPRVLFLESSFVGLEVLYFLNDMVGVF